MHRHSTPYDQPLALSFDKDFKMNNPVDEGRNFTREYWNPNRSVNTFHKFDFHDVKEVMEVREEDE